jgi:hypothetical protein
MDIKTTNNDFVIVNNNLVLVESREFVQQNLKQRLQTLLGECELDTSLGVPYIEEILGKRRQQSIVENILKDQILSTPGVIKLNSFSLEFEESTRVLTVNFEVASESGTIIINDEVAL